MRQSASCDRKPKSVPSPMMDYPVYTDYDGKNTAWVVQQLELCERSGAKNAFAGPKALFPIKLYNMLTDVESKNQTAIVSWLPHGRAFKVHVRSALVAEVLPFHFKYHSSYASFQKQLNAYGYIRLVGQHDDHNAYYHELFLRGRSFLCALMSRQGTKEMNRHKRNPATEPNFYGMKHLHSFDMEVSEVVVAAAAADEGNSVAWGSSAMTSLSPIPLMNNSQAASLESRDLSAFLEQGTSTQSNERELTTQNAMQDSKRPAILSIMQAQARLLAPSGAAGTAAPAPATTVYPTSLIVPSNDIRGLPTGGVNATNADDSMFPEYRSSHSVSSTSLGVDLFDDQSILSCDDSLTLSCGSTS